MALREKLRLYGRLTQIEHALFAFPFSLGSMLVARREVPPAGTVFWIVVALFCGRSFAMALNRYADRDIDPLNPRTRDRILPGKQLPLGEVRGFLALSMAGLALAVWNLPPVCLKLLPVVVVLLSIYSYMKRFTWLAHFILGSCLASAVAGSWIAVAGRIEPGAVMLFAAVLMWVAGFDILYACQDVAFDRETGLHSVPARFGVEAALLISRGLHAGTGALVVGLGLFQGLSPGYFIGAAGVLALILNENWLCRGGDLSRIQKAFFTNNAAASALFLTGALLDVLWLHLSP